MLFKNSGFTAVAVIILALGIGANTLIFSVTYSVLLKPLPYPEPNRLMVLLERSNLGLQGVAWPNFVDWRNQNQSFEALAVYRVDGFNVTGIDEPTRLFGGQVSASLFTLLGATPAIGRVFAEEEDRPGAAPVVVLSHHLWATRFASDPNLPGRSITLNGIPHTIIGVMAEDFRFFQTKTELYVPAGLLGDSPVWRDRGNHPGLRVLGRLRPDVTEEKAAADMETIAGRLEEQYPASNSGQRVSITPLFETKVKDVRSSILLLLAAVGFVLMITCANVANLMLTRASSRHREIAIRTAVGARRWQLIRQLLTESVLLSLIGGAAGILIALWGVDLFVRLAPDDIPRLETTRLDSAVLAFTLGLSMITGILFGLAPAFQSSKLDVISALKESSRSSAGRSRRKIWAALLVVEVALAVVLVIGAGLMIRSILEAQRVNPGFNPENVVAMDVVLPRMKYGEKEQQIAFYNQSLERVRTLPGVESASAVLCVPITGGCWGSIYLVEGRPIPNQSELPRSSFNCVTPDYFKTMKIPLIEGRFFNETDNERSLPVIIINESMARRHWKDESPIGKRIKQGFPQSDNPYRQIVGVVADVKQGALDSEQDTEVYLPFEQSPSSNMSLVVRTNLNPSQMAAAVRQEISAIDKDQPVVNVQTMNKLLSDTMANRRFSTLLLGIFAALALVLASVGVYGVISYSVTSRTHEVGIRRALGANKSDILRLVVGQAMALAMTGVAIGIAGAFALTRLMSSLLFQVSATDAITFLTVALLIAVVALVASFIPARRAAKVDPVIALRYE
jgi:putative ABC transport system permease protein